MMRDCARIPEPSLAPNLANPVQPDGRVAVLDIADQAMPRPRALFLQMGDLQQQTCVSGGLQSRTLRPCPTRRLWSETCKPGTANLFTLVRVHGLQPSTRKPYVACRHLVGRRPAGRRGLWLDGSLHGDGIPSRVCALARQCFRPALQASHPRHCPFPPCELSFLAVSSGGIRSRVCERTPCPRAVRQPAPSARNLWLPPGRLHAALGSPCLHKGNHRDDRVGEGGGSACLGMREIGVSLRV